MCRRRSAFLRRGVGPLPPSALRGAGVTTSSYAPGTCLQARASHILVDSEEECERIKGQIEAGEMDFSEAAVKFSSCSSASRGGKLGKFNPGAMAYVAEEPPPTRAFTRVHEREGRDDVRPRIPCGVAQTRVR